MRTSHVLSTLVISIYYIIIIVHSQSQNCQILIFFSVLSINIERLSEFSKQDITFLTVHDEFDGTIQSVQIVKKNV